MSHEIEPVRRSFCRHRSCMFTEVARLVPSGQRGAAGAGPVAVDDDDAVEASREVAAQRRHQSLAKARRRGTGFGCGQIRMGSTLKVMNFDRLGKKVRPGTFGEVQLG